MPKILYIEDNPIQREFIARILTLKNHQVTLAGDGADGIEKARKWLPDVILTDLRMPQIDGIEAIQILRNDPATSHIPIFALSAWAGDKYRQKALEAGANEHFVKPFDINRMISAIDKYLNKG